MMPFITRKRHEAEMAAKDALLKHQLMAAGVYQQHYEDACKRNVDLTAERDQAIFQRESITSERDSLQSRLDALTPARRADGRFAAKAVRLQPASPPAGKVGFGYGDY